MVNKLLVWAVLLVVVYYVLVELPSPVFVSHASGRSALLSLSN
jgi:hypothetical protein